MARSIGRTYRVVRLAAIGAALATVALTGACSAGQEAATSQVVAAVPGGFATATPDATLPLQVVLVQNAEIVYHGTDGYAAGDTAALTMRIFNQTKNPVTITPGDVKFVENNDRTGDNAGTLTWASSKVAPPPAAPSPSPSDSTPPSAPASGSPSPSDSASATPTVAPEPSIPPITILPGGFAILTPAETQWLVIKGLTKPLKPGTMVTFTLTVKSGDNTASTQVTATFATPQDPTQRETVAPPSAS